jgi:hypothetical protein
VKIIDPKVGIVDAPPNQNFPRTRARFTRNAVLAMALLLLAGGLLFAQRRPPRFAQPPTDLPRWKNAPAFEKDVFTFVRIRYSTHERIYRRGGGGHQWWIDYPDADLNLTYRLQQMTSLKVDPDPEGRILEITDPTLFRYPFIYIVEPGSLGFEDEEVKILRRYLLNGGFLMVDDFWGDDEWDNFATEIKRVFPDRPIYDLKRTDPIFHCVFDIPNDLNLQCPNVYLGTMSQYHGRTWEGGEDTVDVHIRGINDDQGRLCVIMCHNTDNGDGWEQEGQNEYYFREFSEKKSYPLTINIIFYAMTH